MQTLKPFKNRKFTVVALTLFSHNFPTDRARNLFKASKEAENLLGLIFKNRGTFGSFLGVMPCVGGVQWILLLKHLKTFTVNIVENVL